MPSPEPQATTDGDNPYRAPEPVEPVSNGPATFFADKSTPEGELFTATFISMGLAWMVPLCVYLLCSTLSLPDEWCQCFTACSGVIVWFFMPFVSAWRLFNA